MTLPNMPSQRGLIHLGILLAIIGLVLFLLISSSAPFKDKLFSILYPKPSSFAAVGKYIPMHVVVNSFRTAGGLSCMSEDSQGNWIASGSLNPGETFTYTTPIGDCFNQRAISVFVSTTDRIPSSSWVELSTVIPGRENRGGGTKIYATSDDTQAATLCMFPDFWSSSPETYTFTLKNISDKTINNISFAGQDNNDWTPYYTKDCWRSDADKDGFSDALEHAMEQLSQFNNEVDSLALVGSQYAKSCGSAAADDEYDFNPADFNDDGKVDGTDIDRVTARLGQGTGIPVRNISNQYPTTPPNGFYSQVGPWRRFDLDADGWVTGDDVNLVKALLGKDLCTTGNPIQSPDTAPPSVAIFEPWSTQFSRNSNITFRTTAFDNSKVTKVEILANGSVKCSDTTPTMTSLYECTWKLGGKGSTFEIQAKAYDGAGLNSTSRPFTITAF